jgi:hypothetical protein
MFSKKLFKFALQVQRAKPEKKTFPSISNHRILFYTIKNIYGFFLKNIDYTNWKIIAIEVKRIIIFGPFFTGSAHFDFPQNEIFVVLTFIFLKNL